MRYPLLAAFACAGSLSACSTLPIDTDDGAAHIGVDVDVPQAPKVTIDDEFGTDVRVFVNMVHHGGQDAETLEVVSASLNLDHQHYADIELAIPADHPQFPGLADGEQFSFQLVGHIPDNHDDWGLCSDQEAHEQDEQRLSLSLVLRVTPGANGDDSNQFEHESMAVELICSYTG